VAAGATAKVALGSWRHTKIAVKQFFDLPGADLDTLIKECAVHHGLHHPNVVQLLGICQAPLCLLTEWMGRGSLFALLQQEQPWSRRLKFALDTARGMHYLHSAGLLHRDLKSKNILIDHGWNAKVCDFGLATKDASVHTASVLGTVLWSAPELFERTGRYNQSADVYSFGIVLWELWTRAAPYSANPDVPRGWAVIDYIRAGARPLSPDDIEACPPWYEELMTESWTTDPGQRPDFGAIVSTLKRYVRGDSTTPAIDARGNDDLATPLLSVTESSDRSIQEEEE